MKGKKQKTVAVIAVFAILILGAAVFFVLKSKRVDVPRVEIPHEPIRLGGIVSLSGSRSNYGVPLQRAAQLAVDEINQKGGVNGEQLQIFWEDGKCSAKSAKDAADKLISNTKVQFLFGGICSVETLAIAPVAEANHVVVISPASTSPEVTTAGEFIFRLAPSDNLIGEVVAAYAFQKLGAKKAALIGQRTTYISGISDAFKKMFIELGGEVTLDLTYATGDRGSAALAKRAVEEGVDIIYLLPESPTQGLQQLERIQQEEVHPNVIVDEVMLDRELIKANPSFYEGVYGLESYYDQSAPKAQKFLASYQEQFAEEPNFPYFMSNIYDAVYLVKEAIETRGLDTVQVKDWLLLRRNWPGASGDVTFDANGDRLGKFAVERIEAGELKLIEIEDTAK